MLEVGVPLAGYDSVCYNLINTLVLRQQGAVATGLFLVLSCHHIISKVNVTLKSTFENPNQALLLDVVVMGLEETDKEGFNKVLRKALVNLAII